MTRTQTIVVAENVTASKAPTISRRNSADKDTSDLPLIEQSFPTQIVWKNVILFVYLHIAAVYGLWLAITGQIMWQTGLWGFWLTLFTGLSITAGCHRLWAHKSYRATLPFQYILVIFQTIACQNSVFEWCRDHRLHHKYSETHADPHNVNRGFFFAHMGWLMCRKHPAVKEKGAGIDMSDLEVDQLLRFQKTHYVPLVIILSFILPTLIPVWAWGESLIYSWFFASQFRFVISLHATWLVNSAAHLWGNKPYNKDINPSENKLVSLFALGEGFHNYHHTFPWDYKTSEYGGYRYNLTCALIDLAAKLGMAYDLKTVDQEAVIRRALRTGDGSHHANQQNEHSPGHGQLGEGGPWGWGDKDIPELDLKITKIC